MQRERLTRFMPSRQEVGDSVGERHQTIALRFRQCAQQQRHLLANHAGNEP